MAAEPEGGAGASPQLRPDHAHHLGEYAGLRFELSGEPSNPHAAILLLLGTVGALEIEDRGLLGLFATSVTVLVALGTYVINAGTDPAAAFGGSIGFATAAVLLLLLLRNLVKKIEGLDIYAWEFDKARERLLGGVATDERGTPSFKPSMPPRHDSPDLRANLQRAEELLQSFVENVLAGLARAPGGNQPREIKYNVKHFRRCEEKARKDYKGGAPVMQLPTLD